MVARHRRLSGALLLAALLAACATPPPAGRAPGEAGETRPGEERPMRPVSRSLLEQSRDQQRYGNYGQAAATLERAIRIDPAEPAVWLELARVRLAEGNGSQAEQLARKARSLSAAGSTVRAEAVELIADALRMQERPQAAQELEDRL